MAFRDELKTDWLKRCCREMEQEEGAYLTTRLDRSDAGVGRTRNCSVHVRSDQMKQPPDWTNDDQLSCTVVMMKSRGKNYRGVEMAILRCPCCVRAMTKMIEVEERTEGKGNKVFGNGKRIPELERATHRWRCHDRAVTKVMQEEEREGEKEKTVIESGKMSLPSEERMFLPSC